ncbi:MAG: amidohydrolase family protein [Rhodoglobus sp.]
MGQHQTHRPADRRLRPGDHRHRGPHHFRRLTKPARGRDVRQPPCAALTALLAKVPELPVVLDHLAKPPVATGDDGTWERDIRALAALPQVSVKLSGMPPELRDGQELVSAARPWLEIALDAFGADRAMVGSDWPVSSMLPRRLSPGRWLSMVLDELAPSPAEREQLSWRTASRFYGV